MPTAYAIHILSGSLGVVAGYVALYSTKGAPLHRRAGMAFVYGMLTMCATGILMALVRQKAPPLNLSAALLTASLVISGLTTVQRPSRITRRLDLAATGMSLLVAVAGLPLGTAGIASGDRVRAAQGYPLIFFAIVALAMAAGDWRRRRAQTLGPAARLRRHLWRMSFALFVAAGSFFLGQARIFPRAVRGSGLLALPVLAVIATMIWWLWRARTRVCETLAGTWPIPVPPEARAHRHGPPARSSPAS